PRQETVITNAMLAKLDVPAGAARRELQAAQAAARESRRRSRCATTTWTWCGWTPRPSSSCTRSRIGKSLELWTRPVSPNLRDCRHDHEAAALTSAHPGTRVHQPHQTPSPSSRCQVQLPYQ